jgi:hypothetical protein
VKGEGEGELNMIKDLHMHRVKSCKKSFKKGERILKRNRGGGEFDQSTIYVCI